MSSGGSAVISSKKKKIRSEIVHLVAFCTEFDEVVFRFENAVRCQNVRVNVVEFTPIKKARPSPGPIFAEFTNSEHSHVQIC